MSKKVAITGSAGSGKSVVLNFFKEFGARIEDADKLAHLVLEKMKDEVRKTFGDEIMDGERINRRKLGEIVFTSKPMMEKLYRIIGRRILEEMLKVLSSVKEGEILAMEVPLLYEYSLENLFDCVVFVKTSRDIRFKRFKEKTGYSDEIIESIFNMQLPDEVKEKKADYVIDNSGTLEELKERTREVFEKIKEDS